MNTARLTNLGKSSKMNACLLIALLTLVGANEDFNTNEIKKRMKLIGGIPNYGLQNGAPKLEEKTKSDEIEYTNPDLILKYNASADFNARGMGHLFYVTRFFLDHIQPNESYPDDFIVDNDGRGLTIGDYNERWPAWLKHYVGIATVVAVALAFAVLMPLIGLCFCCCRCGGKCGARPKHEKQHDSCKRTTTAIFLGGFAVVILFGVVCAFVTNEHMKEGLEQFTDNITVNLKDAKLYLDNTEKEVDNLLITNFQQLRNEIHKLFNDAGEIVKDQLAVVSHAVALTNLTNIVEGMEVIKQDLAGIQITTNKLQELALTLGEYLDVTREELLQELHSCRDISACRELLNHHHIAELKVVENFNELPDVAQTFATISRLLGDHDSFDSVQKKVLEGQRNFNNIKYEISDSVQRVLPELTEAFEQTGRKLNETSDTIKRSLREVRKLIDKVSDKPLSQADVYIGEYAIYRYYLGLGVSGALLLVLLCITLGLLCGICGKRPEEMYSDDSDCCNTISGGRFLMLAVWLIFMLSTALMLITLAHFLLGVATDMVVCKPLKNPSNNKFFELVDKYVKINDIYEDKRRTDNELKISEVILSFHRNETIYEALKLVNLVNISQLPELVNEFNMSSKIQQFKNRLKVRTDRLQLLTPDAKDKLRDLAESPLNDIHFEKYAQLLNVQITNINLTRLSHELRTNAEKIPDHASSGFDLSKVKKLLRAKARFLELLERDSVAQIKNEIQILKANVTTLKEHLKFNHTSLKDALESLLEEVEGAQRYLWENGTNQLKALLDNFVWKNKEKIEKYFDRVVKKTKYDIGKSAPLSNVYNATLVAGCNCIMDPFLFYAEGIFGPNCRGKTGGKLPAQDMFLFLENRREKGNYTENGFWLSVGWSILLFIPVIILCVKLATLYSKSETYGPPGMYGESEYLYDAYADRDNMPLAMAQSDKKKKNHKNYQESYDNGGNGAYLQDYSAHLGRSDRPSASNEARYNDMAPKHWGDFSSSRGGANPPRYPHHSSTEYERPPPYYYPGAERA